jgi:tetratricopeptide (TPR) repeat protein
MDELRKFFYSALDWVKKNIIFVSIVSGAVVLLLAGVGIFLIVDRNYEMSLRMKFDKAYLQYLSGSKDSNKREDSFRNFLETLQEISAVNKNYDIVAIANIILGDIYYNEGNSYSVALSYYSKATNAPSVFLRVTAIFDVAQVYEAMDNPEAALSTYEYIYKMYPDFYLAPAAMLNMSRLYLYKGDSVSAKKILTELSNKYPNSSATYFIDLFSLILTNNE